MPCNDSRYTVASKKEGTFFSFTFDLDSVDFSAHSKNSAYHIRTSINQATISYQTCHVTVGSRKPLRLRTSSRPEILVQNTRDFRFFIRLLQIHFTENNAGNAEYKNKIST